MNCLSGSCSGNYYLVVDCLEVESQTSEADHESIPNPGLCFSVPATESLRMKAVKAVLYVQRR